MNIFKALLIFLLSLFTCLLSGQNSALQLMLEDSTLTGTSYSIYFADVQTGEVILDYDSKRNLCPASVMKLYPTAIALSLLGEDYRFNTTVAMTGTYDNRRGVLNGDIVIVGGGDPALGSDYFREHYGDVTGRWAAALCAGSALRRVTGRVAAATSCYDNNPVPQGWAWEDIGNYYGAGVYDINYRDNTFSIFMTGHKEGEQAKIDSVEKTGRDILLTNYLTSSGTRDKGYVFNAPYSHEAWITGSIPADRITILKASLPDPPATVTKLLTEELKKRGVKTDGLSSSIRIEINTADTFKSVITTFSPTLGEIVKVTNHESVNLYAEQLCKHLGLVFAGEGSFSAGLSVMKNYLKAAGCEPDGAVILDASGLSPNNNISAYMTVKLLSHMYSGSEHDVFISSLPEAGTSGTMKNYFRDGAFNGRVIAKTGSMTGVRSFGGYVTTASGRVLAFTMIANGFTAPWRDITDKMEKIVIEIISDY